MTDKIIDVSPMNLDGEATKRYKLSEVEIPCTEREKRERLIDENLTRLMTRSSSFAISDAVVNVMSLSQANSMMGDYDNWKLLAMYMAGKLTILEEMKN